MNKKKLYGVIFVFTVCFIWGNSILSAEVSGAISHFIADLLGGSSGSTAEGHFLLRKLAHFTEYAVLGGVSMLFFESLISAKPSRYLTVALTGALIPLIDETIQIFSGRGPSLIDVWIDISGYAVGAVLALVFAFPLISRLEKNVKKSHE